MMFIIVFLNNQEFCRQTVTVMGQVAKCRVGHTRYKRWSQKNEWLRPSQCDGGNHFLERGTHISL